MTTDVLLPQPATALQQGIWVTERSSAAPGTYHMPLVVRLRGALDVGRLLAACSGVVARHPALRRVPAERDGRLTMVEGSGVPVDRVAATAFADELGRPFDLVAGPLARFVLAQEGPDDHVLGFAAHHIVFDGHSKQVLVRDLAALYDGAPVPDPGSDAEVPPLDPALVAEARAWWEQHPPAAGDTAGPGGAPLPDRTSGRGAELRSTVAPRVPGLSAFEVLLAALHVQLWGYGNDAPVTAVVLSTRRPDGADDDRIGLFVNEVPFTTRPAAGASFAEFGADVRRALRDLYRFRTVPLAVARPGLRPHTAVAPVSLSHRDVPATVPGFTGLTASVAWLGWGGAVRGAVQLVGAGSAGGVELAVRYDDAVDGPRVAADLADLVAAITADPDRRLGDLVPRRAVAATGPAVPDRGPSSQPAGPDPAELLEQVRLIWQEVLRIAPVHDDDDVFDLGGHSLNITQIIARMRADLRLTVSLDEFFDHSTVAGVVAVARRA
jgi:acyl carrier protein